MEKTELAQIVGEGNVYDDELTLGSYSHDMSFANPVRPAAVVRPHNAEEVYKIVLLARKKRIPLVPVSSGPPHFRGDTVPGIGGAVVVDLSEMKRIIHIDRKNRVVMFEPGVTFGELSQTVSREGLRLNMPLLPRRSKSVLGSLLEREPVTMPKYHWDIADPLACTEIIYGTGEIFRTGAAAGSGTIEEQWSAGGAQKEAAGPSSASWYRLIQGAQGTMGIVTWASARCELLPTLEDPYFIGSITLDTLLEVTYWLIRLRMVNECLIVNNTNLALMATDTAPSDHNLARENLPLWILFFNIAAYNFLPEERIVGLRQDVMELLQQHGVEARKSLAGVTADRFLKIVQQPSPEPYWKLRSRGGCQDIFFLTLFDKIDGQVKNMMKAVAAAGYSPADVGIYLQPVVQGVNCHCEFNLFYKAEDQVELSRVKKLNSDAVRNLMESGAFFSRPYGDTSTMIMNRDAATVAALKKVKSIVDPLGIMNPGKLSF